jgi:hypothetical protein
MTVYEIGWEKYPGLFCLLICNLKNAITGITPISLLATVL